MPQQLHPSLKQDSDRELSAGMMQRSTRHPDWRWLHLAMHAALQATVQSGVHVYSSIHGSLTSSAETCAASAEPAELCLTLASSVLPTPVGPRNMKDAMGRPGSDSPIRDLDGVQQSHQLK